jgi:multiple sugar transport system ATP-binding protein
VYVTHDQSEALTMASRVVVMNQGRIQQVGTPDEVYSQPANLFVAEFVGLPRINLLPASVSVESGRTVLQTEVLDMQVDWASPSAAMVVAVRPEDIALSLKPLADSRPATVYSILTAGPEEFINARFGDTTLVVRNTNQGKFEVDQEVWVSVRAEKCNFYQQATGQLHTPTEER